MSSDGYTIGRRSYNFLTGVQNLENECQIALCGTVKSSIQA